MLDRKPKFRSRKLEYNRPLQVLRYDEAVDLDDYDNPMRSVPLVSTGVDKEEEEEHHLQVALTTSQVTPKDQSYVIPTPESAKSIADYDMLYPPVFKSRKGLIRHTGTIEDLSFRRPKYTADSEDIAFLGLKGLNDNGDRLFIFEHVVGCFEETASRFSEGIVSVDGDDCLERIRGDLQLNAILERECPRETLESWLTHWKDRRRQSGGVSLILSLKFEDVGKVGSDPYVCFRRRELKQPRKTRRSDNQINEKIRKIRYDFQTLQVFLRAGLKRDKLKKEVLLTESAAFEKYLVLRNWQLEFGIERPPTLPSFKTLHLAQPLPDVSTSMSKKAASGQSSRKSRKMETDEEGENNEPSDDDACNGSATVDLVKISIPPAAIRNVKFSRPYYPFEVVKQIQSDVEALLAGRSDPLLGAFNDYTADLGSIVRGCRSGFRNDLLARQSMFEARHSNDGDMLVLRKSRNGRFVRSRTQTCDAASRYADDRVFIRERMFYPTYGNFLRSIQARDCAHLNNAFVGNYNQHYIQSTANLAAPTTLSSWIAATAGILSNKSGGGSANSSHKSSSNNAAGSNANSTTSPSKKKRAISATAATEDSEEAAHKKTKTATTTTTTQQTPSTMTIDATISNLSASPQFTVKVKARADQDYEHAGGANGGNIGNSMAAGAANSLETATIAQSPPKRSASTAASSVRFTPTGLQKGP